MLPIRYRRLVDHPHDTVNEVLAFLGLPPGAPRDVPRDNTRPFRPDSLRTRSLARAVRIGAAAGSLVPPRVWRVASRPLLWELHRGGVHRPELTPGQRAHVLEPLLDDIALLERLTGDSFEDWRAESGRGSYASRVRG